MKTTKKSKKKNRTLILIILLAVVALLVCGYFVAKSIKEKREAEEARKAEEEAALAVTLTNYTLDDVKSIFYMYKSDSVEIELENGIYYIADDHDFPLDQSKAKVIANQFASIKSKRLLENTRTNFSVYGLDQPDRTIKVTYADGTTFEMAVGDYNKNVDAYYGHILNTYSVYLFDPLYVSTLEMDLSKLFYTTDEITIKSDTVRKIELDYSDSASGETSCEYNYSASDSKWTKLVGSETIDDTDKNGEYITGQVLGISFESYAGYAIDTDEELEKYGLLDPYASLKLTYLDSISAEDGTTANVEKSITVDFGVVDDKAYFKLDESDIVYNVDIDSVDGIITAIVSADTADTADTE